MSRFFMEVLQNQILIITLMSWAFAQTIKVVIGVIKKRRFDFRWFIGTGGMPSAHASGATTLAFTIGIRQGFDTTYFALATVFAVVTMFDAQGVRRSTGKQAAILNKVLEDIYWQGKIEEGRLKELIGHTPLEVFLGSIIGLLLAIIFA